MRIAGEDVIDQDDQRAGIGTLLGRLVEDGKAYAQAEIGYVKVLASERLSAARSGAVFLLAGFAMLQGALIALFVGLVIWLATLIGPLWSMLIVVLGAILIGAVLAKIGLGHFRRARSVPELPNAEAVEP